MNGGTTHSFQTPPQVYPAFDGHGSTNETKLGLFYGMNCTYPSPDAQNLSFCTSEPQGVTGCTDALPEWALLRLAAMQVVALALSIVLPLWYANYPGTDRSGKNWFRVATACSSPTKANGGFTVIAFIVIFGFTMVFYSMLFADATGDSPPCSLPMGSCTTISCICGNYYAEGYVFMFVVMGLVAYTFFTEFAPKIHPKKHVQPEDRRYHWHYSCRFWSKQLVSFGILCVVLTGMFPAVVITNNHYMSAIMARTSVTMHVLGLAGGAFSMLFSFVWYLLADKRDKDPNPKLGTAVRSIHVIAFIYFIYLYQEAQSRAKDDVTNHCWGLTNQEMCEYWPCSVYYENPITNDGEFVHNDSEMPRYTCKWVSDHDSYQPYDSTEFIKKNLGKCIKDECALFQNATSVMTELCVLWLLLTYIVTYASNDLIVLSRKDLALVQCFPCGELVEDPNHENHQSLDEEDERHGEVEMLRAEVASLRDKVAHL